MRNQKGSKRITLKILLDTINNSLDYGINWLVTMYQLVYSVAEVRRELLNYDDERKFHDSKQKEKKRVAPVAALRFIHIFYKGVV